MLRMSEPCRTENIDKQNKIRIKLLYLCRTRVIRTPSKRRYLPLFVKLSLEVRIVRRRSTLPKIIENRSVLVADKSCAHVFR